jgi:cytosine/adenosine deaminase-related metal-dependent hydrolase
MITTNAARAIGLSARDYPYRLESGAPADLVLVGAPTWHQALQYRPPDRVVIAAGRIAARTESRTEVVEP